MNSARFFALSVALLLGPACGKKQEEAGAPATAAAVATNASSKAPSSEATDASRALSYLPKDSEIVFGISVQSIVPTMMWKMVEPMIASNEKISGVREVCITSLLSKLRSIQVAARGEEGDELTAVTSGVDQDSFAACLRAIAEKAAAARGVDVTVSGDSKVGGKKVTVTVDDHFIELKKEGDEDGPILIYFPDKTTAIIAKRGEKSASRSELESMSKGTGGIASSPEAMAMVNQAGTAEPVWFALRGDSPMFAAAAEAGVKFKTLAGSLAFDGGLRGKVTLKMTSAEDAKATAAMAQGQLAQAKQNPMMGPLLATVTVEASGSDIKAGFSLTDAQLGQLAGMASMFQ